MFQHAESIESQQHHVPGILAQIASFISLHHSSDRRSQHEFTAETTLSELHALSQSKVGLDVAMMFGGRHVAINSIHDLCTYLGIGSFDQVKTAFSHDHIAYISKRLEHTGIMAHIFIDPKNGEQKAQFQKNLPEVYLHITLTPEQKHHLDESVFSAQQKSYASETMTTLAEQSHLELMDAISRIPQPERFPRGCHVSISTDTSTVTTSLKKHRSLTHTSSTQVGAVSIHIDIPDDIHLTLEDYRLLQAVMLGTEEAIVYATDHLQDATPQQWSSAVSYFAKHSEKALGTLVDALSQSSVYHIGHYQEELSLLNDALQVQKLYHAELIERFDLLHHTVISSLSELNNEITEGLFHTHVAMQQIEQLQDHVSEPDALEHLKETTKTITEHYQKIGKLSHDTMHAVLTEQQRLKPKTSPESLQITEGFFLEHLPFYPGIEITACSTLDQHQVFESIHRDKILSVFHALVADVAAQKPLGAVSIAMTYHPHEERMHISLTSKRTHFEDYIALLIHNDIAETQEVPDSAKALLQARDTLHAIGGRLRLYREKDVIEGTIDVHIAMMFPVTQKKEV